MEEEPSISRREALTWAGGGTLAFAGIGGASLIIGSQNASATMQVEGPHLEVTSPDGTVEEINLRVSDARAEYENLGGEFAGFHFVTSVNGEQVFKHSAHKNLIGDNVPYADIGSDSGWMEYDSGFDRHSPDIPIFENSSLGPGDFEVEESGGSETFDLNVEVECRVYDESGWPDNPAATASDSVTAQLTINNEGVEPTVTIGGGTIEIEGES